MINVFFGWMHITMWHIFVELLVLNWSMQNIVCIMYSQTVKIIWEMLLLEVNCYSLSFYSVSSQIFVMDVSSVNSVVIWYDVTMIHGHCITLKDNKCGIIKWWSIWCYHCRRSNSISSLPTARSTVTNNQLIVITVLLCRYRTARYCDECLSVSLSVCLHVFDVITADEVTQSSVCPLPDPWWIPNQHLSFNSLSSLLFFPVGQLSIVMSVSVCPYAYLRNQTKILFTSIL